MVRVSEKFLQQITLLAKDGSSTIDASTARLIDAANPVNPQDLATKIYVDTAISGVPLSFTLANVLTNGDETAGLDINFTSGSQIVSDDYLEINTDSRVLQSFFVKGSSIGLYTDELNIESGYAFFNQNYTTVAAQTGGVVINYLPTSTATTVAATGFVAGVASVSNPTVRTVGSGTFSAGDLIMISGAHKETNDGLYEVLSHSGTLLTIRGVGTSATLQGFSSTQFETDTTVAGTITKVNVSVLRSGTDGVWEVGKGSTNSLSFNDLVTSATGLPPTGAAGGDLISPTTLNNYPNPLVKGFTTEIGTGTQLTYGTINNTQLLVRSGTTVVGLNQNALSIAGQVTGTLSDTYVNAGTFSGTPLTFGSVTDGQFLVRSGSTIIGASSTISGPAGGDLDGYYPNPNVVAGTFDTTQLTFGAVADGDLLIRYGNTIVGTPADTTPTGPAGGDLDGYYPDPNVIAGTFNTDTLTFGAVADGEVLIRSGNTIVGATAGSTPTGPAGGDLDGNYPDPSVKSLTFDGYQNLLLDQSIGDGYILTRQGNSIVGSSPVDLSAEVTILDAIENCTLGGCGSNVDLGGSTTYGNVWGCLVLSKAKTTLRSMSCLVKQANGGSNTLKMGIYTFAGILVGKTVWGDCSTTGLKTLAFESPITLDSGTLYYMTCLNMANGALLLGRSSVGEPGTTPIVSWSGPNYSDLPTDISAQLTNTNTHRVWVAGRP